MTESTARAERFERDSPVLPSFTWTVPQKPVAVRIPLAVIEKLEREAVESYRSLTSRGSEIGGVLFGAVAPGTPALVEIDGYETVPCEYAAGPLYHLSEAELAKLDRMLEERRAAGQRAVGFFRSQTRKGLSLDAADLALMDSRFAGAHEIALVIRPSATKASTAGIFIREDGKIRAEASYLEFPFRATDAEKPAATAEGSVAGPRNVPAAPAAPLAPRPVVRAQIVPIASRREVMPAPVSEPAPEVPAAPQAPAPAPVEKAVEKPVEKAGGKAVQTPVDNSVEKTVEKSEPAPKPPVKATKPEPAEEVPAKGSNKLLWIALGTVASLVLIGGLLFTSGALRLRNHGVPATTTESGLALRIERNAGDILLTWNRDADVIKRATRAVLSINDGPQHENVEMDLAQLRTGSIVYSPVTGDVVFEMQVTAAGQSQPVAEMVRVLRTRPSPMPDQTPGTPATTPAQAQAAPKPGAPAANGTPAANTTEDDPAAEPKEEKVTLTQPVKAFHAESLAQRLRPTRPEEIADIPAPVGATPVQAVNGNLSGILGGTVAPPAAPKLPAPAAPAPSPEKKAAAGGQIEQAVLIRKRDPEYPKLARESGASGVVELTATIGVDGKVKGVTVVKGHPLLRQAAVDAVKTWIYRPTLLNGKPVETQTQVLLNFKAER